MKNFDYLITSDINREKLSCEIYYQDEIFAEITQETDELIIEIYSCRKERWWKIPLNDLFDAISYGRQHLLASNE